MSDSVGKRLKVESDEENFEPLSKRRRVRKVDQINTTDWFRGPQCDNCRGARKAKVCLYELPEDGTGKCQWCQSGKRACYINGVRRRPRPGQGSLQKSVATFSTSTVPPEDLTHDFQLPPVVGEDSQDFSDSSRSSSPSHSPQASMEADMNRTEDYTQDHILKDDTPKMNIEDEELDPEDLRPLEGSSSTGRAEPHQATATLNGSQKSNSFGFFSQHRWRAMENERTGCLQELREALNVEIERRRDNMTAQRELHESRVRIQRDIQELELRMKSLREEKIRNEEERFAERESRVWINARVEKLEGEIELVEREIDEIREAEKNQFAGKDHEA